MENSRLNKNVTNSFSSDNMLIPAILQDSAEKFPTRKAFDFFGFSMSYRDLWAKVQRFSESLYSLGIRPGDRVVLLLPNCPHFIISYYAVVYIGAIVVPTNPLYGDKELAFQVNDSGADTIITLDMLLPAVNRVMDRVEVKRIIAGKIQDFLPALKKFIYPILAQKKTNSIEIDQKKEIFAFQDLLKTGLTGFKAPVPDVNDVAVLQYTGGTTGLAKGAMLTHRNIVSNNLQMRRWYSGIEPAGEVCISVLPFFHSYGSAVAMNLPVSVAATMVIFPQFKAEDILKAIKSHRATLLPGIPSIYSVLNSHKNIERYDISSIKYCISGAAPLPVTVLEEFERKTGGIIIEGYGLSEASPVTHANPIQGRRKTGSIGLPMWKTECRIVDVDTGEPLPAGSQGELCVRGPQVMAGYWNNREETDRVLSDGWLYTGDIARVDEDGYYYIVERKKDMIISEGFNVYPRELEEFLLKHPRIADSAVIGIPDKLRGERVVAYVVLKEGEEATPEEIIRHCRDNLVKYKVPKKVVFKKEIPRNMAGKKLRRVLREEFEEKTGRP